MSSLVNVPFVLPNCCAVEVLFQDKRVVRVENLCESQGDIISPPVQGDVLIPQGGLTLRGMSAQQGIRWLLAAHYSTPINFGSVCQEVNHPYSYFTPSQSHCIREPKWFEA